MATEGDDFVGVICRQTTLSPEEAAQKLAEHGGDPVAVIKEFMQVKPAAPRAPTTNPHQMIYREIEQFMESISPVRLPTRTKEDVEVKNTCTSTGAALKNTCTQSTAPPTL